MARRVEPDLLYRVAKADSLGRYPDATEESDIWFGSQEWFIQKVVNEVGKSARPILLGGICSNRNGSVPEIKRYLTQFMNCVRRKIMDIEGAYTVAKEMM